TPAAVVQCRAAGRPRDLPAVHRERGVGARGRRPAVRPLRSRQGSRVMTEGAYVDAVRIRTFVGQLQTYVERTRESGMAIRPRFRNLGDSWRDQEYARFLDEFQHAEQQLGLLLAELERIAPVLEQDAAAADEIHRARL